ncbi:MULTISPECIES: hypothetical protein [Providencia]|uniref:Uncharacterized protein n=2 Tax=Providencia rustigianii TaxID=158850 RepID=D1P5Q7_9GAMM|nr:MULTISPECIES: hypothetical protein [Providencia]EFB71381.1 hypothetical protein PROVRUST_07565 [Providencia rustigianii DSM 4541]MTC57896.1 hypothetical protein [Providencia rustigianii]MTC59348.1 hypothetical protein [Providencia rustigianii]SPY78023.1 Uncharacterised protein [Providencia rustigianii]SUC27575.1 Uncharacterised protein [Providencia rustigianii]
MAYWTAGSVPELKGLDRKTQGQLFRQCLKEGKKRMGAKYWKLNGLVLLLSCVLAFVLYQLNFFSGGFLGGAIIGGLIGLMFVFIVQTPTIDLGREWLREQGYPKQEN